MKHLFFLCICLVSFSFVDATYAALFKKENVQVYDLKNLESDLKKDYVEKDFEEGGVCDWRSVSKLCNSFQIKASDDQIVRSFIKNLKEGKKKNAADVFNGVKYDKYGNTTTKLFPIEIANFFSISYGVIPFHNGVLGIVNEGQAGFFKFFYIVVHDNKLIRVKMDTELMPIIPTSKDNPKTSTVTLVGRNTKGQEIDRFDFTMDCKYIEATKTDTASITCDEKEAFRKYLFGITKNKAFDEWRNAYQKKIKSIKSFSKLGDIEKVSTLIYKNRGGFTFNYPNIGNIGASGIIKDSEYQRIENYKKFDDSPSLLKVGEYYIEILKTESSIAKINKQTCQNSFSEITSEEIINTIKVYKGLGIIGGESGGIRYGMCFEKNNNQYYIQYTENGSLYKDLVFNSLKFTN